MTTLEQMRDAWDKFASGYDEAITPFSMRIAEDALRQVDIRPGMRFLDVAAGGGALSIPAARLGAQVLATDFSAAMVGRLKARAREEGLSNLESRVMDGHGLELEDNTFDISGSQFGIMLFPDRPRALGELARVTKPGGQALMVVFGPPRTLKPLPSSLAPCELPSPALLPHRIPRSSASRTLSSYAGKWPQPD
jgi:ubiquinone/menaquinone biosynthesis C-methylase UbiE